MKNRRKEINIPYYIMEELEEYQKATTKGNCKCMKWENIKALLRLAKLNGRLTNEQISYIESNFCREII